MMNFIGEGAALLAALSWTISGLVTEKKGKGFSPWALNFLTKVGGILGVSLMTLIINGRLIPQATGRQWLLLMMSGLLGFSLGDGFLFAAYQNLGAKKAMLIYSANPIFAALLGSIFLGEMLTIKHVLGILLAVLGIMWVIQADMQNAKALDQGKNQAGQTKNLLLGVLFAVLATLGQVTGAIFSKASMADLDAYTAAQIRLVGGNLGMMILLTFLRQWPTVPAVCKSRSGRLTIMASVILGTLIGMVMSMIAIKMTQVAVASMLMSLMPVMILPISAFFLKEKVTSREVYGALLTLFGVVLLLLPVQI